MVKLWEITRGVVVENYGEVSAIFLTQIIFWHCNLPLGGPDG